MEIVHYINLNWNLQFSLFYCAFEVNDTKHLKQMQFYFYTDATEVQAL